MTEGENDILQLILERLYALESTLANGRSLPWLTCRETAHFLRCSESQVNRLTDRGLLSYRRLNPEAPKSQRLFHRKHLTAYLVAGRNPVTNRLTPQERREVQALL